MGNRRLAREAALQSLFQEDFNETSAFTKEAPDPFTKQLLDGVSQYRTDIDRLIETQTEHWAVDRMAIVDRNVLRMAIFEMVFSHETPAKVVIDEAIEIAKKYGNENSGAFVNGILDGVRKIALEKAETA
ncbi:MAG: transcription antitermination factor NusB [Nitrospirota bacterium]